MIGILGVWPGGMGMSASVDPSERARVNKFEQRRLMLAESALAAIAERGYAQTGLRDVAQYSDLSHGSLHYYFDDKDDLIALAVWTYKSTCARRYDDIIATSTSGEELVQRFGNTMANTLRDDAAMHRLWYDLRNQALFSEGFRDTIIEIDALLEEMVWAIISRYAELEQRTVIVSPAIAYALFDGLFQNSLIQFFRGNAESVAALEREAPMLLGTSTAA